MLARIPREVKLVAVVTDGARTCYLLFVETGVFNWRTQMCTVHFEPLLALRTLISLLLEAIGSPFLAHIVSQQVIINALYNPWFKDWILQNGVTDAFLPGEVRRYQVVFVPQFVARVAASTLVEVVFSAQFDQAGLVVEVESGRALLAGSWEGQVRLCPACASHLKSYVRIEQVERRVYSCCIFRCTMQLKWLLTGD